MSLMKSLTRCIAVASFWVFHQQAFAFADPVEVDELALSQYLESSVFLVSACNKSTDSECESSHVDEFIPEGTATVFHISSQCEVDNCVIRTPIVYFITAAHVSNRTEPYGCAFSSASGLLNTRPLYLSKPLRPQQAKAGLWIELVVKAREIAKMGHDCAYKKGDRRKPALKYDAAILELESAQLVTRTSDSENDVALDLTPEQSAALIGDNYSRHALIATRFLGTEGVGGLTVASDNYGYFMGFPISIPKEQEVCSHTKDGSPARNLCIRKNTGLTFGGVRLNVLESDPFPKLGMLPENLVPADQQYLASLLGDQGALAGGQAHTSVASAGFSGSTIHYYHGGRLHLLGILHGRDIAPGRSLRCKRLYRSGDGFGGLKPSDCDYIWFTRMDDPQMWQLFANLPPGDEIVSLAKAFRQLRFTPLEFAKVDRLNDLETFWFGLRVLNNAKFTRYVVSGKEPAPRTAEFNELKRLRRAVMADLCPGSAVADSPEAIRVVNLANFGTDLASHFRQRGFRRIAEILEDCLDTKGVEMLMTSQNYDNQHSSFLDSSSYAIKTTPTLAKFADTLLANESMAEDIFQPKKYNLTVYAHMPGVNREQLRTVLRPTLLSGWSQKSNLRNAFLRELYSADASLLFDIQIIRALAEIQNSELHSEKELPNIRKRHQQE